MRRPVEILLVDDNPADVDLARETFADARIQNRIHSVGDGREALEFLRRQKGHIGAPRPDLILLDLNMPGMDGRELLAELKQDDGLKHIPVIVLTTSGAREDVQSSYELHANCYLRKPVELEGFIELMRSIEQFWMTQVELPGPGR